MLRKWKLGAAVVADQLRENRKKEKKNLFRWAGCNFISKYIYWQNGGVTKEGTEELL